MTQPPNRNLLKETLQYIKNCGKITNDILWVASADGNYAISWNEFEKIADSTEYGRSGITPEIAVDLVVVFNDEMWLSRKIISEIPIEDINRPLTSIWQFAPAIDIIQISHETYRSKMFIHDESVTFQLPLSQYLK
jgi:hypothetical protein